MTAPADAKTTSRDTARDLAGHLATLAGEVDATRSSTGFRVVLDTLAQFWRYSPTNQWLIHRADRFATRVAGKTTWARLGRAPRAGELPIWILAPTRRGFPFVLVPVYDVRQTEGQALPSLDLALAGDDAPVEQLERAAAVLGIRVVVGTIAGRTLGTTIVGESRGGEIWITPGLPRAEHLAVLAHELAHELLHQGERARKRPRVRSIAEEETEAEATSYVVLRALGLPSKAPAYIAWRGGAGEDVLRSLTRIQRAARTILDAARPRARAPRQKAACA